MPKKPLSKLPAKYQEWVDARNRHRLSHAHIQMARELGFLPKSLRKIDDSANKPWKAPLSGYIEDLYFKKFGRERPENITSIEEMVAKAKQKKADRKDRKGLTPQQEAPELNGRPSTEERESESDS